MKGKLLVIFGFMVLISCSKNSNSSSSSTDFEIDGIPFLASVNERIYLAPYQAPNGFSYHLFNVKNARNPNDISVTQELKLLYFSKDSVRASLDGVYSGPCWSGYNKVNGNFSKTLSDNIAKGLNVVKNQNGTYTVNGNFIVYKHSDGFYPRNVKVHFTTKL